MAKFSLLPNTWEIIKEVDLRPLREQALRSLFIAIVGEPGSGRSVLASQMRRDPTRPHLEADTPIMILDLETADQATEADLIILMMDSRKKDSVREQGLVKGWHNSKKRVIVFINQIETPDGTITNPSATQRQQRVVWGPVSDCDFLLRNFAPVMIDTLRDQLLSLGRHFPLFRVPIAHYLINDTCMSNAAYALSTGLAEIVAVLDIPIAVADIIILTKNQAYLAYKLGLALGYSTRWADYVVEFGGVLGGGFIWRQAARTLVGFIPVWGIIPKTAISYAGTYVVGHAVLQWYLTGRHISGQQVKQLYNQAFERGKEIARNLMVKLPRPHLPKVSRPSLPRPPALRIRKKTKTLTASESAQVCVQCGQLSAENASFCQYCGQAFEEQMPLVSDNQLDQSKNNSQSTPP